MTDNVDNFVEQQKAIIAKEKEIFNNKVSVPREKNIESNLYKQKVCLIYLTNYLTFFLNVFLFTIYIHADQVSIFDYNF